MLDQNTDRMWYVIGAVLIGAAIIFGMNTLMPNAFASISDNFKQTMTQSEINVDQLVGRQNLLVNSYLDEPITTSDYYITRFDLAETPVAGETYTFVLKGQLGDDRVGFDPHNAGASASISRPYTLLEDWGDGYYGFVFEWNNYSESLGRDVTPTHVNIYQKYKEGTSESTVEWATLVKGDTPMMEWRTSGKE